MAHLVRIILAISLVLQSLPGISAEGCAVDSRLSAAATFRTVGGEGCRCCCAEGTTASFDRCDVERTPACCCGESVPDQPASPPTNPSSEQVRFVAAVFSAQLVLVYGDSGSFTVRRVPVGVAPARSANSIQSVLCVWVM